MQISARNMGSPFEKEADEASKVYVYAAYMIAAK
jgi:hypothetical protein